MNKAYQAKCYAVEPPRQRDFTTGERVVFLRPEHGHSLFALASDTSGTGPFIIDNESFNQFTEEVKETLDNWPHTAWRRIEYQLAPHPRRPMEEA